MLKVKTENGVTEVEGEGSNLELAFDLAAVIAGTMESMVKYGGEEEALILFKYALLDFTLNGKFDPKIIGEIFHNISEKIKEGCDN